MLKISIHAITVAYNFNMLVIGEYIVGVGHYLRSEEHTSELQSPS